MTLSCDGCTLCCKILHIEELSKPANRWCSKCEIGVGCSVYEARPDVCVGFRCYWLMSQTGDSPMDAELRPDRSHFILREQFGIPARTRLVIVDPSYPEAWRLYETQFKEQSYDFDYVIQVGEKFWVIQLGETRRAEFSPMGEDGKRQFTRWLE